MIVSALHVRAIKLHCLVALTVGSLACFCSPKAVEDRSTICLSVSMRGNCQPATASRSHLRLLQANAVRPTHPRSQFRAFRALNSGRETETIPIMNPLKPKPQTHPIREVFLNDSTISTSRRMQEMCITLADCVKNSACQGTASASNA